LTTHPPLFLDNDIQDIDVYDNPSNGWYRSQSTSEFPVYEVKMADVVLSRLPRLFESIIEHVREGDETQEFESIHYAVVWAHVTSVYGRASFEVLLPVWHRIFSEPLTKFAASILSGYQAGIAPVITALPIEDFALVINNFSIPFVLSAAKSPDVCTSLAWAYAELVSHVSPLRLRPVLNLILENTSGSPNSTLGNRLLLDVLIAILRDRPGSCYTSIDFLYDHYIKPFFTDITQYSFAENGCLLVLFFVLLESAIVPEFSPLYDLEINTKFEWLLSSLTIVIANGDPTARQYQEFITHLLSLSAGGSRAILAKLTPIIVTHMPKIVTSLDTTDIQTEELMSGCMSSLCACPQYATLVDEAIDLIRSIMQCYPLASIPVKKKLAADVRRLLYTTIPACPKEKLLALYDLVDQIIRREKNVEAQMAIVNTLGFISLFSGQLREMTEIEAAAILVISTLFNEVDPLVRQAFELIRNKIETEGTRKTTFWQEAVRCFWAANSEHLMPKIEEELACYRSLTRSSYFS
jgi:hypothetical protein